MKRPGPSEAYLLKVVLTGVCTFYEIVLFSSIFLKVPYVCYHRSSKNSILIFFNLDHQ